MLSALLWAELLCSDFQTCTEVLLTEASTAPQVNRETNSSLCPATHTSRIVLVAASTTHQRGPVTPRLSGRHIFQSHRLASCTRRWCQCVCGFSVLTCSSPFPGPVLGEGARADVPALLPGPREQDSSSAVGHLGGVGLSQPGCWFRQTGGALDSETCRQS